MPRGPRLDAPPQNRRTSPGVLPAGGGQARQREAGKHHVMVRGIERRALFRAERDRADRVAALAEAKAWSVVAWALLPNHAHLLVRTGRQPLAAAMRALLTGYAGAFNAPEAHKSA